jgi:hypothetical protein
MSQKAVERRVVEAELADMFVRFGGFDEVVTELFIERGYNAEFLRAQQTKRRKQQAEVKATAPQQNVGVEKKESSQQLIQRLADTRATVENVDDTDESDDEEEKIQ